MIQSCRTIAVAASSSPVTVPSIDSLMVQLEERIAKYAKPKMTPGMAKEVGERIEETTDLRGALQIVLSDSYKNCSPNDHVFSILLGKDSLGEAKKRLFALIPHKNEFHYNIYLKREGISFSEAQTTFAEACAKKIATVVAHNTMITAAGKAERFAAAHEMFNTAVSQGVATVITYSSFLDVKGYVNSIIYNTFLNVAGKAGRFDLAKTFYEKVCEQEFADAETYAIFIEVAGIAGEFAIVQTTLNRARQDKKLSSSVCANFIIAAGNQGQIEAAEKVFAEGKTLGLAGDIVRNAFLNMEAQLSGIAAAEVTFRKTIDVGEADAITYTTLID